MGMSVLDENNGFAGVSGKTIAYSPEFGRDGKVPEFGRPGNGLFGNLRAGKRRGGGDKAHDEQRGDERTGSREFYGSINVHKRLSLKTEKMPVAMRLSPPAKQRVIDGSTVK